MKRRRKAIPHLDVLGQVRRAQRILNRVTTYLEQQERRALRVAKKRAADDERPTPEELAEQG